MIKNTFLTNFTDEKFIDRLRYAISNCKSFSLSVSFIKKAGLVLISDVIEEALKKGIKANIITSTYQNFTDIPSLELFLEWQEKYPNFKCNIDFECFNEQGFHSKGYLFEYNDSYEVIIGSTNITRFALLKNVEWNISTFSKDETEIFYNIKKEFDDLWNKTLELNSKIINQYKTRLEYAIEKWDMDYVDSSGEQIIPNGMQRKALKEIRRYRDLGVNKALVVSATGSGKTYLACFDAKNFGARRVLFICHRDKILNDAKNAFMKIFGNQKTFGLYVGKYKEIDADFIFASNILVSQNLSLFDPKTFDYICIDEAHHSVSSTYKKIVDYFKPEFLLGITATPERMDNQDVFELFDKNVPYELRLRDAIINDLVVPFHYYGIRDKLVDYKSSDISKISREIAKNENIEFIINEIEKHEPEDKLKCLAFCTSISHAMMMAEQFNSYGYKAVALTGKNDLSERTYAFKNLQDENNELKIICTVDILNEGVDIPKVNMVLFLRPTESTTVFLQQLGRGLRKAENKKYVKILDFIGNNYDRSIQIAFALGTLGKSTIIEKSYLIDLIRNDFNALNIPGVIVDIDELSKEEIIENIKKENFNKIEFLKKDYENFKEFLKTTTYPKHMDYLNVEFAPNLIRLIKSKIANTKNRSYYRFLQKIGETTIPYFNEEEVNLIDNISDLLPLVRPDEFLIINELLNKNKIDLNKLKEYNTKVTDETLLNAVYHLQKNVIIDNNKLSLNSIQSSLKNYLIDLIEYGLTRYEIEFGDFEGKFKLYRNYYKEQIMRVLCEKGLMFMKGTKFNDNGETFIFVGLKKDKEKLEKTNYKDKFLSSKIFQWESENNTTFENTIGKKIINTKKIHLFVRKMDDEDGITLPFTYFGTGIFSNIRESFVESKTNDGVVNKLPTLLTDIILDNDVPLEYHFDFEIKEDKYETR